jgi:hypothetical protein
MKKYQVSYLIDIVSKNPDDYTVTEIVEAENEIDAVKKVAISITRKDSSGIEWIKNMQGGLNEVICELMQCNYCFTSVCLLNDLQNSD